MTTFSLNEESFLTIYSTSSVHPITWTAKAMSGSLTASLMDSRIDVGQTISGNLEIQVRDLKSGTPPYDLQLPRAVHAKRFPAIKASLSALSALADEQYLADGTLSFHGTELAVEAPIRIQVRDGKVRLSGELETDLRHFGFQPPKVLGLSVHPEVRVEFAAVGQPASG